MDARRVFLRFMDEDGSVRFGELTAGDEVRVMDGPPMGKFKVLRERRNLEAVRLLSPVEPPDVMAIGLNYRAHADEGGHPYPERPVIFIKASSSVIGPGQAIELPGQLPDEVDYEAELAVVIGRSARCVSPEDAPKFILGYTCGNDVSARDAQQRLDKQWARGKSCDTFCPLGPWIVQGLDPANLAIRSRLNGKVMQDSNTSDLIFDVNQLVSFISQTKTLRAGDVIMTGTPGGVGVARRPQVFLREGDVIEVEIEGIGTLKNPVARQKS